VAVLCFQCGDPVEWRRVGAHREVIGWEEIRSDGGANKIVGRKETGRWAHKSCVGQVSGQERMFK
jgi:hypothetical protein